MSTDRSTLKNYFKNGLIPDESQFAEMIDSGVNTVEDGLQKSVSEPLKVESGMVSQELIHLYKSFSDPGPSWRINQNPDIGGNVNKEGFSILDSTGAIRMYIDKANGNVGIGTTNPTAKMTIHSPENASNPAGNGFFIFNPHGTPNSHATAALSVNGPNSGDPFISFDVTGVAGWSIGIDNSDGDKLKISNRWDSLDAATRMTIEQDGKVGIGTTNPLAKVHLHGAGPLMTENANGIGPASQVPLVLQGSQTLLGLLNTQGRQSFALNLDGNLGTPEGRGVPTFYDKYDGNWRSSLHLKNGKVGIGTSNPTQRLDVAGNVKVKQLFMEDDRYTDIIMTANDHNQTWRTGVNQHGYYIHGNTFDLVVKKGNGNVGIGTTEPKTKFHVNGDIYSRGHMFLHAYPYDGQSGTAYIQARDTSNTSDISMTFRTQNNGVPINSMVLSPTGNVGIGTLDPREKLHIDGVIRVDGTVRLNGEQLIYLGETPGVEMTLAGKSAVLRYRDTTWEHSKWTDLQSTPFSVNNAIGFTRYENGAANAAKSVVISDEGFVGIGTSTPQNKLHVGKGLIQIGNKASRYPAWMDFENTNGVLVNSESDAAFFGLKNRGGASGHGNAYDAVLFFGDDGDDDLLFESYHNGEIGRLTHDGKLGLGVTNPTEKFEVNGRGKAHSFTLENNGQADVHYHDTASAQNWQQGVNGHGFFLYQNGFRMVVKKDTGNVGIGTTSPSHKLQVDGTARLSGRTGGALRGTVPANGQWHNITGSLNGLNAYEVIASASTAGYHCMAHGICCAAFGGHTNQCKVTFAVHGPDSNKIEMRFVGSTYDYYLQIRTAFDYPGEIPIQYSVSQLHSH